MPSSIPSRFIDELPDEHVEKEGGTAMQRHRVVAAPSVFAGPFGLAARRPTPRMYETGSWEVSERPARAEKIRVGERVFHQKFGYGRVTAVEDDRLDIDFEKAGPKRVLDRFVEKA